MGRNGDDGEVVGGGRGRRNRGRLGWPVAVWMRDDEGGAVVLEGVFDFGADNQLENFVHMSFEDWAVRALCEEAWVAA